jgi:hypothetical protein
MLAALALLMSALVANYRAYKQPPVTISDEQRELEAWLFDRDSRWR